MYSVTHVEPFFNINVCLSSAKTELQGDPNLAKYLRSTDDLRPV